MANTSDGGKGDPPDPSNYKTNTDALLTTAPAAHRAKNDQVSPDIDQVLTVTINLVPQLIVTPRPVLTPQHHHHDLTP